ncbi:CAP domain-containing protein [Nonomuraea jabiensis]|uniref:SCP domain-containing protein n=1 Tax=Nonomuraea jabiensis TaxID=882448 RepID=A0A7W9LF88_9ACTN|nr:CAP domain-containing protein [Nonomuraea jabiensis]MBB5781647.1 hypothetical protein [Nonomuraea jabiensis]
MTASRTGARPPLCSPSTATWVATAGHCAYDTDDDGHVLDRWVFVPGYYQGRALWGIYAAKQAFTHYDFDVYEDFDRDYAFVSVYNGLKVKLVGKGSKAEYDAYLGPKWTYNGEWRYAVLEDAGRLGDAVGGQGIAYNIKPGQKIFAFGYPAVWSGSILPKDPKVPDPRPTKGSPPSSGTVGTAEENEVVRLTNAERTKGGCKPLTPDPQLRAAAFGHSDDMAKGQPNPASVVQSWMNSPGHRNNIMNCAYTLIGVGMAENSGGTKHWTQVFAAK